MPSSWIGGTMAITDLYDSTGELIVRTVTAGGALPVAEVNITVRGADRQNSGVLYQIKSDQSGNSQVLTLPTPSAALSKTPGNLTPYATYDLLLEKEGYFLHEAKNIPVFGGVTSLQTVEMIPVGYRKGEDTVPKVLAMIEETEPFGKRQGG